MAIEFQPRPKNDLVIASNRGRQSINSEGNLSVAPGGVGRAMSTAANTFEGTVNFVSYPGVSSMDTYIQNDIREKLNQDPSTRSVQHPVHIPSDIYTGYYAGEASALWRANHDRLHKDINVEPQFTEENWEDYFEANNMFAKEIVDAAKDENSVVFVNDFQLMLVGQCIRDNFNRPNQRIGYFHHIPWPEAQNFAAFPHADSRIKAMLAYDSVGFHTTEFQENFVNSAKALLGDQIYIAEDRSYIEYDGRITRVHATPIGIDIEATKADSLSNEAIKHRDKLKHKYGSNRIMSHIARADYTKNPEGRAETLISMMEDAKYADVLNDLVHIEVVAPSRGGIESFDTHNKKVKTTIERANCIANRQMGRDIIDPNFDGLPFHDVVATMAETDIYLGTVGHDGYNMTMTEFIAVSKEDGVLIMSENAGAVETIGDGALVVNPYDIKEIIEAIQLASNMTREQKVELKQKALDAAKKNDLFTWFTKNIQSITR